MTRLNTFAAGINAHLGKPQLLATTVGKKTPILAWLRPASDGEGSYLFLVHFGTTALAEVSLPLPHSFATADLLYATEELAHEALAVTKEVVISNLLGGRCYLLG